MASDALRPGRCSLSYQIYSITTVCRGRRPLFADFNAARLLVRELRLLHDHGQVTSLAWVVMPDHLHWLIQLGEDWSLSNVVKSLKARSALALNRYSNCRGSVWQRAFFDHAIRKEEDVRQLARYIVANPLRAGLVRDIGDYPHWDCIWMSHGDGVGVVE